MKTLRDQPAGLDPCLQIQADLSAMLDGELDDGSVRRVMVHSDVCISCRVFLDGIRDQARAHRDLTAAGLIEGSCQAPSGGAAAASLRRELMANKAQLSRILYELGRGFALMGLSPGFSKIVAREPVPVPDMAQKGRNLLHEVAERAFGSVKGGTDRSWVRARELFENGSLGTPEVNLEKGEKLLRECLVLDPSFQEARIYLGMVHHVMERSTDAERDFEQVLASSQDENLRGFAQVNLGNVFLETDRCERAIELFEGVVESGLVDRQPRFGMIYFNLALACGLLRRFDRAAKWFTRLEKELPHKKAMVARELQIRDNLKEALAEDPRAARRLASQFPGWFPIGAPSDKEKSGSSHSLTGKAI